MAVLLLGQFGCTGCSYTLALWARALGLQLREQLFGGGFFSLHSLSFPSPLPTVGQNAQCSCQSKQGCALLPFLGHLCCPHLPCCPWSLHPAPQSWSHRIVCIGRGLKDPVIPNSCPERGHLPLRPGCSGPIQAGFGHFQGRESHAEGTQKAGFAQDCSVAEVCTDALSAQKLIPAPAHAVPRPAPLGSLPGRGWPWSRGGKDGLGRPPASRQCIASLSHATSAACMAYLPCLCGRAEVKFPPSHTNNSRNYSRVLLLNTRCPAL